MTVEHMGPQHDAELDEVIRMGTNIEQLIKELCPDGVPYVALGEFAEIQRGSGMPKSILTEEGIGAIHYGQIYTLYGTYAESTFTFVSKEDSQKLVHVNPGDLIITNTSENLEDVGKSLAWVGDEQVVIGGHACVIRHKHNSKYLAYWMQTEDFQQQKRRLCTGTKVIELSAKKLTQIVVPLPPVEVQEEIVRILDLFTTLEAELEAELEKRVAQYAHYRDVFFASDQADKTSRETVSEQHMVWWSTLGEMGSFVRGSGFQKSDFSDEGGAAIHYGQIHTIFGVNTRNAISKVPWQLHARLRKALPGDLIIATTSEDVEAVATATAWLGDEEVAVGGHILVYRHSFDPSYVSHFFTSSLFQNQKRKYVQGIKVKDISAQSLGKILVPVPPIEEQRRIAGILDQMDALVNDLSSGLPAEIAARRKQYEYYRDRLLSFPELTEPAAMASPNTQEPTRA